MRQNLSYVLPLDENNRSIELNEEDVVNVTVFIPNVKLEKENPKAEVVPSYVWQRDNVTIVLNHLAWYVYALWALAVLLLGFFLFYYKRYKNPLVVKLENQSELLNLNPTQLKEAKDRLSKINRFQNILTENFITTERYAHAESFEGLSVEKKVNYLSQRFFAKTTKLTEQGYALELNDDFPLNVKQFILFVSDKESVHT